MKTTITSVLLLIITQFFYGQNDFNSVYAEGNKKYSAKDYTGALKDFETSTKLDPSQADGWYMVGLCKYSLYKDENAIPAFDKSIKLKEAYDAFYWRGMCKYNLKNYDGAISDLTSCLRLKPDYSNALYWRGMCKYELKNYEEGITDFSEAINLKSDYADAYLYRGACRYYIAKDDEALKDLNLSITLNPSSTNAYYYRGLVNYQKANDAEAIADLSKSIDLSPWYSSYYFRGAAKYNLKNYEGALSDYHMSTLLKPDYWQAWQDKALSCYMLAKDDSAIANFTKAIALNPKSGKAYYYRGQSKSYKGDKAGSEADLKKAADLGYSVNGGTSSGTNTNYSSTKSATSSSISASLPEVDWLNPILDHMNISEEKFLLQACLKSSEKITSCKLNVNGSDITASITEQPNNNDCKFILKENIVLVQGANEIKITLENAKGEQTTETRHITLNKSLAKKDGEKRIALIIGNSNYTNGSPLKNPVNDAELMANTLSKLGFDVIKRTNADKKSMEDAVKEFARKIPDYNVVLFYYAGHGMQIDGMNYLLPVDITLQDKNDAKFEAVSVNFVVEELERYPNNTSVVILDACRNNPFRSFSRGGEQGFKAISPASGTIISFATSEGSVASDGSGNNGLFTEELVKQIVVPQPIESVFKKTRVQVEDKSANQQSPQEWSKLKGDFYFVK